MKSECKKQELRSRRIARTRAKVDWTALRPRLTVRRSLSHIYVQVVDDAKQVTLVAFSDADLTKDAVAGKKKIEVAFLVGKGVAERARAKNVERVVFDRRDKKYHGRVKAVADGAREGGLQF